MKEKSFFYKNKGEDQKNLFDDIDFVTTQTSEKVVLNTERNISSLGSQKKSNSIVKSIKKFQNYLVEVAPKADNMEPQKLEELRKEVFKKLNIIKVDVLDFIKSNPPPKEKANILLAIMEMGVALLRLDIESPFPYCFFPLAGKANKLLFSTYRPIGHDEFDLSKDAVSQQVDNLLLETQAFQTCNCLLLSTAMRATVLFDLCNFPEELPSILARFMDTKLTWEKTLGSSKSNAFIEKEINPLLRKMIKMHVKARPPLTNHRLKKESNILETLSKNDLMGLFDKEEQFNEIFGKNSYKEILRIAKEMRDKSLQKNNTKQNENEDSNSNNIVNNL
jgi:hypothetical protein